MGAPHKLFSEAPVNSPYTLLWPALRISFVASYSTTPRIPRMSSPLYSTSYFRFT